MNELMSVLPRIPFLRDEDQASCESLAALASCRTFPKGNILFHDGDPCHAVYLVISGRVKLVLAGEDGRELALEMFDPGDVCGMVGTLDEGPHVGTAMTLTPARIAMIPSDAFRRWLAERPRLHQTIVIQLTQMLRHAYDRVGMQVLLSVKHRVRAELLELARKDGAPDATTELVVRRPTHQEIAERVGSTREVVSRALKTLLEEDAGIQMEGRVLRVSLRSVETPDLSARGVRSGEWR